MWESNAFPVGEHLKSPSCEIRCFFYLNSKVITIKNNSRIIIKKDNSLLVIINHRLSLIQRYLKGKASDLSKVFLIKLYQIGTFICNYQLKKTKLTNIISFYALFTLLFVYTF